jgi:hypothetical protein
LLQPGKETGSPSGPRGARCGLPGAETHENDLAFRRVIAIFIRDTVGLEIFLKCVREPHLV